MHLSVVIILSILRCVLYLASGSKYLLMLPLDVEQPAADLVLCKPVLCFILGQASASGVLSSKPQAKQQPHWQQKRMKNSTAGSVSMTSCSFIH